MKIADLYADIHVRDEQFHQSLAASQSRFQGFAGSVTGMVGKIASGIVVAQTAIATFQRSTAFLGESVMRAADLGEQMSKNSVVFGAAGQKVVDMAEELATKFGIVRVKSIEAASSLGLVFKSAGMDQSMAADMSIQLVKLATDLSSFNNIPVEEIFMKLRSGLVGEAEPLRSLGVMIDDASMKTQALAMGLGGVGRELTQGEKIQARFGLILKQTTDAQGDLARTSTSVVNVLRRLSGSWEEMSTKFGQSLVPIVESLLPVADRLLPVLGSMASEIGTFLEGHADEIKELAKAFSDNLIAALYNVHDYMGYLISDMKQFKDMLGLTNEDIATLMKGGLIGLVAKKSASKTYDLRTGKEIADTGGTGDLPLEYGPSAFHPEFQGPHAAFGWGGVGGAKGFLESLFPVTAGRGAAAGLGIETDATLAMLGASTQADVAPAARGFLDSLLKAVVGEGPAAWRRIQDDAVRERANALVGGPTDLMQSLWGGLAPAMQMMGQLAVEKKPDFKSQMMNTADIASQVTQAALSKQQDPIKKAVERTAKASEESKDLLKGMAESMKDMALGAVFR